MQLDKYIKTDLEQAEKLQISALSNRLACVEKGEAPPIMNISNISVPTIKKVIKERYNTILGLPLFYYNIPNTNYGIKFDLLNEEKYIYVYRSKT